MERTHPWLSFPGSKIKNHRLVVELQHFENLVNKSAIFTLCTNSGPEVSQPQNWTHVFEHKSHEQSNGS